MLGIPIGWVYANAGEWLLHKHMLHGIGLDKKSFWSFHWHEHHRESRQHDMFDAQYVRSLFTWSPQGKEAAALLGAAVLHLPLLPVFPFFTGTLYWSMVKYYREHKKSHLDPEYARRNLPWHYDHHMGKDQNANWCVTHPFFDYVMGTRKKYRYDAQGRAFDEDIAPSSIGTAVASVAVPS